MRSEKVLRLVIMIAYAFSMTHLLWTGAIYRFVGNDSLVFAIIGCVLLWLMVAFGALSVTSQEDHDTMVRDVWLKGTLYAVLVLPPAVYLIGAFVSGTL